MNEYLEILHRRREAHGRPDARENQRRLAEQFDAVPSTESAGGRVRRSFSFHTFPLFSRRRRDDARSTGGVAPGSSSPAATSLDGCVLGAGPHGELDLSPAERVEPALVLTRTREWCVAALGVLLLLVAILA